MANFSFDFNKAMSLSQYFESKGLEGKDKLFKLKACHPFLKDEDGDYVLDESGNNVPDTSVTFMALGLANGETTANGNPAVDFFRLSRKLVEDGVILDKAFLKENIKDIRVGYVYDDNDKKCKFGTLYLPGDGGFFTEDDL